VEKFFLGMHRVGQAWRFDRTFISVNQLRALVATLVGCESWVMDSGAFTEVMTHGGYRDGPESYAEIIRRFSKNQGLEAAVAQDYMCESEALARTGLTVADHQRLTIERYDALMACDVGGVYLMPVLQGYDPEDYARHVRDYGARLGEGAWVGVGSVCKRQGDPEAILAVLEAILAERPDLKLQGFGVKLTSLRDPRIAKLLHSADSMAWSFAARKRKGDSNSLSVARAFEWEVLQACGLEPGYNLAHRVRAGTIERWADEDNAKAAVRRAKNAEWKVTWKQIQADAAENDRQNAIRREMSV
jgi:hypothetical protein